MADLKLLEDAAKAMHEQLPAPAVPDKATTDYITTIEVLRAHIARLESAAPAVREPLSDERLLDIALKYWDYGQVPLQHRPFARAVLAAHGITGDSK